jgi:group I intron endonuclease
MIACIYKFTNKVNGKIYIGQTKSVTSRLRDHLRNTEKCPFKSDLALYGWKAFKFEVLEFIEDPNSMDNLLSKKEQFYIDIHIKMGINFDTMFYNDVVFVESGSYKMSPEHKEKLSLARTNIKLSTEHIQSMSETSRKRNAVESLKKHKPTRENISKALRKRSIHILQYNLNGDFIKEYETQADAAKAVGKENCEYNINKALKKIMNQAYGYQWRYYKENYEIKIPSVLRKVQVLDYNKNEIAVFDSPILAAKSLNIDHNRVLYALNGSMYNYSQGHYFYYFKENGKIM